MMDAQAVALLTCHGKQEAISAPLAEAGYAVFTIDNYDTDQLGTFTGEIARQGTMLDAATRKAQLACSLSGARFGLGSEGSFGGDPWVGVTAWAREIIVWHDAQEQLTVSAFVQGPQTNYTNKRVTTIEQAIDFATAIGFPQHGIIVEYEHLNGSRIYDKSCTDISTLTRSVQQALAHGAVNLSTDMRAHRNPTRMQMIAHCARDLAARLATPCPQCQAPGFGAHAPIPGARCEDCGCPTQHARAVLCRCVKCGFENEKALMDTVPASRCDECNP